MEEPGEALGCSSRLSGIVLSAHAGQACQDVGMGGWRGDTVAPAARHGVRGLGHTMLLSAILCFPGGHI